jgi:hypothetical protein
MAINLPGAAGGADLTVRPRAAGARAPGEAHSSGMAEQASLSTQQCKNVRM